jgi:hypothetical protein
VISSLHRTARLVLRAGLAAAMFQACATIALGPGWQSLHAQERDGLARGRGAPWYGPRDFSVDREARPPTPAERAFERPAAPAATTGPLNDNPAILNQPGPESPSRLGPWPCPRTGAAALCD